jgi:hypothetical protein
MYDIIDDYNIVRIICTLLYEFLVPLFTFHLHIRMLWEPK